MVFRFRTLLRFRTHKLCPLGDSLLEGHGAVTRVHKAFIAGMFIVQRGEKKSSLMALDQSQEQSIQFLKEDSGAKGLYGQQESKEVSELSKRFYVVAYIKE